MDCLPVLPIKKRHRRQRSSFKKQVWVISSKRLIIEIQLLITLCLLPAFVKSYNDSLGMSQLCQQFCDIHRSGGWRGAFQFDCDEQYDTYDERNNCRRRCNDCPDIICHMSKPDTFYCPSTTIENIACDSRCNDNREKGSLDGFILNCNETYKADAKEKKLCHQECSQCPRWVCDPKKDDNMWYCPTVEMKEKCQDTCEKLRARELGSDTKESFELDCDDLMDFQLTQECTRSCKNCPSVVCDPEVSSQYYYCPSLMKPSPLTTTTRRPSTEKPEPPYEGRCKNRCDKYRLGGGSPYRLQCEQIFKSRLERDACREDCENCPSDICYPGGSEGPVFDCPAADNYRGRSMMNGHMSKHQHSDIGPVVALSIAAALALLFLIGGSIYYMKRKQARRAAVVPEHGHGNQAHAHENPAHHGHPAPNHSPDESTLDLSVSGHQS